MSVKTYGVRLQLLQVRQLLMPQNGCGKAFANYKLFISNNAGFVPGIRINERLQQLGSALHQQALYLQLVQSVYNLMHQ